MQPEKKPIAASDDQLFTKEKPTIWGMILGGNNYPQLRQDCYKKNEIRLGWSEIKDDDEESWQNTSTYGVRRVEDFRYNMEIGDFVVVQNGIKHIDAIGVITGDYVYDEQQKYPRSRAVQWLATEMNQDAMP